MSSHFLGIDIGTTSTKVILIDALGHILAEASRPAVLSSPHATWAEEDPEQWWQNIGMLIPQVLSSSPASPREVAAIGVSGMVPTLILLDAGGRVLRPSVQQNDARAVQEIEELQRTTDPAEILARTGSAITQQSIGPKLLWLRRHEPDSMDRAAHLMGSYDYIAYRLTGEFSIERNWALESGFFDLHREDWDDDLLRLASINREWLGTVHWPAEVIGELTEDAAHQVGLVSGIPVVAGTADHIASAFSAGLRQEGDLLVKLGGAGDILFSLDQAEMDPRLFLDYHVIPGKYLLNGCMASSGSLIRWFRDQFAPGLDYADLDREADRVPAGSEGLVILPYFLGEKTPLNDPLARGTIVGLTLTHTRAHIYRAILEGIAFGFEHHLQVLAEHNRLPRRVRLTNGGAHSLLWRQVTADVLGLPLEQIAHHPGSSLGAAFVAGMGVGGFHDWNEIERFIEVRTVTEPDPQNHACYQAVFAIYREVYENLKSTYPKLAAITARAQA